MTPDVEVNDDGFARYAKDCEWCAQLEARKADRSFRLCCRGQHEPVPVVEVTTSIEPESSADAPAQLTEAETIDLLSVVKEGE